MTNDLPDAPRRALAWLRLGATSASTACLRALDLWRRWRAADAALTQMETLDERELFDIGMTRVDVHRVARGASTRDERCATHPGDHAAAIQDLRHGASLARACTRHFECYR